jgi:hypothetical protein
MRIAKLPPFEMQAQALKPRKFVFDFYFPEHKLAVEVDGATFGRKCGQCGDIKAGGRHSRGSGIETDAVKYSLAAGRGIRVVRVTKKMIDSGEALTLIEGALAWKDEVAA